MGRLAVMLFLGAAACAHEHVLDRDEVGAMKNDTPAISPWYSPDTEPIADDGMTSPVVDRVREMAVQVLTDGGGEDVNVASGVLLGGGIVLTDLRTMLVVGSDGALQRVRGVPESFAGAPVVDDSGALAGLLVGPTEHEIILVSSARLLQIVERVRPAEPKIDDHI